jgi:hypothetical protein
MRSAPVANGSDQFLAGGFQGAVNDHAPALTGFLL